MSKRHHLSSVPQTAIKLTRYSEMEQFADKFAENQLNLVGIVGSAGLRKSRTFLNSLTSHQSQYLHVRGHVTAFILYSLLFHHRDKLVVIDDADSLFAHRSCATLLKCLLETEDTKVISWHSKAIDESQVPRTFTTQSKAAVLCNEWRTVNENMRAVEDRGIFIHFAPSVQEVHEKVGSADWFDDHEVYGFMEKHLHLITEPSMRYYLKASDMKRVGIDDWQGKTLRMLNPNMERLTIVSRLLADDSIVTEAERVARYVQLTNASQATFYRDLEMLLRANNASL